MTRIPQEFKEFLQLLNLHKVEYILLGGYAVSYHGYPRTTNDIDIWISFKKENIEKIKVVLNAFGFGLPENYLDEFWEFGKIIRMGMPPLRIELISSASGIDFDKSYQDCIKDEFDGIPINIISIEHLKLNKKASGRKKDLNDLENLP
ncbi:MAG: hypothetical protein A2X61_02590 [Ignavibacteria bacterium GWB2_35_12]|nr:MAG: hypothetical protein A2X63_11360 [Ignavibacteria bacterium GWA2_35_8]OGU42465.1 MAG: hypothetical protein A2X61_02590 [Ignavibacteria bacterium GWB2_35_12]OGU96634.1 MAG: hypothetical protein A2220_12170 [Ignavibacteria bacterium RIFOXYA2_FULL_35_10]OGV24245.1 MAG: hypothetical protein A2475_08515 [Ignavibacteria bacterium RIFOXYC2_FULL_35_21]